MILSLSNSDVWIFCRLTYSIEHSVVEAIDDSEISVHIDFFFLPHLLSTRGRAEREVCLPSHRSTADCGEGASAGGSELGGEIPGRSFQEIWKNEGGVGGLSKGESLLSCSEESWEGARVVVNPCCFTWGTFLFPGISLLCCMALHCAQQECPLCFLSLWDRVACSCTRRYSCNKYHIPAGFYHMLGLACRLRGRGNPYFHSEIMSKVHGVV